MDNQLIVNWLNDLSEHSLKRPTVLLAFSQSKKITIFGTRIIGIPVALLNALKINALEQPLQQWYEEFATAMEDGVLTPEESAQLQDSLNSILEGAEVYGDALDNFIENSPFEDIADTSLTGAIKGVTEETAGLIAGQMNAIRMNQAKSVTTLEQILEAIRVNGNIDLSPEVIAAVQGNGSINLPTIDLPQFENFTQVLTDFLNGNKTNGFNQIESLSIMTQQLDQLQQINRNTSYNRELTRIRQILDEIKNDPSNNIRANGGY